MSVKVGDTVYLWCHAYLRLVGRVGEVLGVRRVALENASKVLSDSEGDEQFFARGVAEGTVTAYIGHVSDVGYLGAFAFPHPLPGPKKKSHGRRS